MKKRETKKMVKREKAMSTTKRKESQSPFPTKHSDPTILSAIICYFHTL